MRSLLLLPLLILVLLPLLILALLGLLLPACGETPAEAPQELGPAHAPREEPWRIDRRLVPPVPAGVDVLEHLARYPGQAPVPEGVLPDPWYGEDALEKAATKLAGKRARPWTVAVLLEWLEGAEAGQPGAAADGRHALRAALVTLLAASRRPEALGLVGPALNDDDLSVRVAATMGIREYWAGGGPYTGGLEIKMHHAALWWRAYQARLAHRARLAR